MTSPCFVKTTVACGLAGIKGGIRGDGFRSTCSTEGTMMATQSSKVLLESWRYV